MARLWIRPVYGSGRNGDGRWEMDGGGWGWIGVDVDGV
jgi:hypothetical protein